MAAGILENKASIMSKQRRNDGFQGIELRHALGGIYTNFLCFNSLASRRNGARKEYVCGNMCRLFLMFTDLFINSPALRHPFGNVQFSDEDADFQDEGMKRARLLRTTLRGELSSFMSLRKSHRRRKQAFLNGCIYSVIDKTYASSIALPMS
ncbi:hypothetical protein [Butyrivibrio sp. JL13D10]|uniref:hypothetical protein n=1 Tax=Butyrivibrio sp. JL13D10 TaxID=3236815 RepID=UPI0038B4B1AE